jgi:hypothetical protein
MKLLVWTFIISLFAEKPNWWVKENGTFQDDSRILYQRDVDNYRKAVQTAMLLR